MNGSCCCEIKREHKQKLLKKKLWDTLNHCAIWNGDVGTIKIVSQWIEMILKEKDE